MYASKNIILKVLIDISENSRLVLYNKHQKIFKKLYEKNLHLENIIGILKKNIFLTF